MFGSNFRPFSTRRRSRSLTPPPPSQDVGLADEPGIPSITELPSRIPSVRAAELAAIRESRAPQAGDAAAGPRIRMTESADWTGINPNPIVPRAPQNPAYDDRGNDAGLAHQAQIPLGMRRARLVCESCGMARGQNPWCDGCRECREWELLMFPLPPGWEWASYWARVLDRYPRAFESESSPSHLPKGGGKGRDQEPSCHCLRWRRSREDWPTMCVCESMPGNGSGDLWVNTDTKKKTAPRKAKEGKQWEAAKGQWSTGRPGGADPSPAGAPSAGPALPVQRPQSMVESPGPAAIQPPPPPSEWTGKWSRW